LPGNRVGNQDFGAETPRRVPRDQVQSHTCSWPKSANWMPAASLVSRRRVAFSARCPGNSNLACNCG
jgi:hypothetical protein